MCVIYVHIRLVIDNTTRKIVFKLGNDKNCANLGPHLHAAAGGEICIDMHSLP